jgi:hypothetical protein
MPLFSLDAEFLTLKLNVFPLQQDRQEDSDERESSLRSD